ncbi:MAG: hypothetical protein QXT46_00440 [Pyrobaculum sp.]
MVCLEPFAPDEFTLWYRQLGRIKLFWAKPVVELFILYRLVDGCVLKARWSSDKPKLEEVYITILKRVKKLDFLLPLRGTKILITPEEIEKSLYSKRGSLCIYQVTRPCASGVYINKKLEGHPDPAPDHIAISSGSDMKYLLYLNTWSFNIDYLWLSQREYFQDAVLSAICEARRLGGRYVSIVTEDETPPPYKPDYYYNVYKLNF